MAALIKKRQAHADNADNHYSERANEGPPKVVVGVLVLEAPSFGFIPKRCLRIVGAIMERFGIVNARELGSRA